MRVYASHVTSHQLLHASYYFCTLRAAEDEAGRTQHEGQQWERGLSLVNISCMNKLDSEYIHIPYIVTGVVPLYCPGIIYQTSNPYLLPGFPDL
jgi:hypothetical protein